MTENSLVQFAQVIADQPTQDPNPPTTSTKTNQRITLSQPPHYQATRSSEVGPPVTCCYLPIRKNACIVCGVCFTCSRLYGTNCICEEVQPRRGKNLPEGSLDSRAKKLHPQDKEDYEFSMNWLSEHAHTIYKNESGTVVGLRDVSEVSLCKAHSSTLYRAKKRHERSKNQAPPSPSGQVDSSGMIDVTTTNNKQNSNNHPNLKNNNKNSNNHYSHPYFHTNNSKYDNNLSAMVLDPYPLHPHLNHHYGPPSVPPPSTLLPEGGGLAAKVREISFQQQQQQQRYRSTTPPDFSIMQASTSLNKRKRTSKQQAGEPLEIPHSSASTPLYGTGMAPLLSHHPSSSSSATPISASRQQQQQQQQQQHRHADNNSGSNFSLPPLHSRASSLSALSSSFQNHLHLSSPYPSTTTTTTSTGATSTTTTTSSMYGITSSSSSSSIPPSTLTGQSSTSSLTQQNTSSQTMMTLLETVSLKSMDNSNTYYFRNLAINDSFTFRDLLKEIDMTGTPPVGKRIVVADEKNEIFFPLDQAIRSVIRRPLSSHLELCLGLSDKPSINWNSYV
ncbi:hypothetical protein BDC45DRAFT_603433 [Circinella umbellata]|nr:hypothetical protein BDC45DRAFT_603433 [Circinella umbellata]